MTLNSCQSILDLDLAVIIFISAQQIANKEFITFQITYATQKEKADLKSVVSCYSTRDQYLTLNMGEVEAIANWVHGVTQRNEKHRLNQLSNPPILYFLL